MNIWNTIEYSGLNFAFRCSGAITVHQGHGGGFSVNFVPVVLQVLTLVGSRSTSLDQGPVKRVNPTVFFFFP